MFYVDIMMKSRRSIHSIRNKGLQCLSVHIQVVLLNEDFNSTRFSQLAKLELMLLRILSMSAGFYLRFPKTSPHRSYLHLCLACLDSYSQGARLSACPLWERCVSTLPSPHQHPHLSSQHECDPRASLMRYLQTNRCPIFGRLMYCGQYLGTAMKGRYRFWHDFS